MKNFSRANFLSDLEQKQWDNVHCFEDPNEMWNAWENMLMETINQHAPLKSWRIKNKKSPWITTELRRHIFNSDYLKRKAISSEDPEVWHQYRQMRNKINNDIKTAKRVYFTKNLE